MLVRHALEGIYTFGVCDIFRQIVSTFFQRGNRTSLFVILSCRPLPSTDGVGSHGFYFYDYVTGMTWLWYPHRRRGNACTSQSYLHVLFGTLRLGGRVFLVWIFGIFDEFICTDCTFSIIFMYFTN